MNRSLNVDMTHSTKLIESKAGSMWFITLMTPKLAQHVKAA